MSDLPSGFVHATADARRAEALGARLPPLLVAAERVASTVAQGVHGRRRVGQGDSFWQFRPYVSGDPVNRIDWRQSARSGRDEFVTSHRLAAKEGHPRHRAFDILKRVGLC